MVDSLSIDSSQSHNATAHIRDATLAQVLGRYLYLSATNFLLNEDPPVAPERFEPAVVGWVHLKEGSAPYRRETPQERLHQARVALRRLRSTMSSYERAFDTSWRTDIGDALKWYGGILGTARDLDVMREHLAEICEAEQLDEVRAPMDEGVTHDAERALEDRRSAQQEGRYERMVEVLAALPHSAHFSVRAERTAHHELVHCLNGRWHHAEESAERALADPSMAHLHRLRIDLKRVQYASSVLAMLGSSEVEKFTHDVEKVQTKLGVAHDLHVARRWVTSLMTTNDSQREMFTNLSRECHSRESGVLKHWARDVRTLRDHWDALGSYL